MSQFLPDSQRLKATDAYTETFPAFKARVIDGYNSTIDYIKRHFERGQMGCIIDLCNGNPIATAYIITILREDGFQVEQVDEGFYVHWDCAYEPACSSNTLERKYTQEC